VKPEVVIDRAGRIVELAPTELVASAPAHPYTLGLLRSFPDMRGARRELRGIPGTPPDLRQAIGGCAFAPRCDYAFESCATILPQSSTDGTADRPRAAGGERAACHLHNPGLYPGGPPPELSGERPRGPLSGSQVQAGPAAESAAGPSRTADRE
jgi:peptide/nickel transport system ATP-binding protein